MREVRSQDSCQFESDDVFHDLWTGATSGSSSGSRSNFASSDSNPSRQPHRHACTKCGNMVLFPPQNNRRTCLACGSQMKLHSDGSVEETCVEVSGSFGSSIWSKRSGAACSFHSLRSLLRIPTVQSLSGRPSDGSSLVNGRGTGKIKRTGSRSINIKTFISSLKRSLTSKSEKETLALENKDAKSVDFEDLLATLLKLALIVCASDIMDMFAVVRSFMLNDTVALRSLAFKVTSGLISHAALPGIHGQHSKLGDMVELFMKNFGDLNDYPKLPREVESRSTHNGSHSANNSAKTSLSRPSTTPGLPGFVEHCYMKRVEDEGSCIPPLLGVDVCSSMTSSTFVGTHADTFPSGGDMLRLPSMKSMPSAKQHQSLRFSEPVGRREEADESEEESLPLPAEVGERDTVGKSFPITTIQSGDTGESDEESAGGEGVISSFTDISDDSFSGFYKNKKVFTFRSAAFKTINAVAKFASLKNPLHREGDIMTHTASQKSQASQKSAGSNANSVRSPGGWSLGRLFRKQKSGQSHSSSRKSPQSSIARSSHNSRPSKSSSSAATRHSAAFSVSPTNDSVNSGASSYVKRMVRSHADHGEKIGEIEWGGDGAANDVETQRRQELSSKLATRYGVSSSGESSKVREDRQPVPKEAHFPPAKGSAMLKPSLPRVSDESHNSSPSTFRQLPQHRRHSDESAVHATLTTDSRRRSEMSVRSQLRQHHENFTTTTATASQRRSCAADPPVFPPRSLFKHVVFDPAIANELPKTSGVVKKEPKEAISRLHSKLSEVVFSRQMTGATDCTLATAVMLQNVLNDPIFKHNDDEADGMSDTPSSYTPVEEEAPLLPTSVRRQNDLEQIEEAANSSASSLPLPKTMSIELECKLQDQSEQPIEILQGVQDSWPLSLKTEHLDQSDHLTDREKYLRRKELRKKRKEENPERLTYGDLIKSEHEQHIALVQTTNAGFLEGSELIFPERSLEEVIPTKEEEDRLEKESWKKRRQDMKQKKREAKPGKMTYGELIRNSHEQSIGDTQTGGSHTPSSSSTSKPSRASLGACVSSEESIVALGAATQELDHDERRARYNARKAEKEERKRSGGKISYGALLRSEHEQTLDVEGCQRQMPEKSALSEDKQCSSTGQRSPLRPPLSAQSVTVDPYEDLPIHLDADDLSRSRCCSDASSGIVVAVARNSVDERRRCADSEEESGDSPRGNSCPPEGEQARSGLETMTHKSSLKKKESPRSPFQTVELDLAKNTTLALPATDTRDL